MWIRSGSVNVHFRCLAVAVGLLLFADIGVAQEDPATIEQAAKVYDLRKFETPSDARQVGVRRLASLTYNSGEKSAAAYEAAKKQLLVGGWKELPGGYATNEYASGTFANGAYRLSISAMPTTGEDKKPVTMIAINNHGNIAYNKLPLPPGAEPLFVGDVSAMFLTAAEQKPTIEKCRELLVQAGWQPYGEAGDQFFFKKNAVRLSAYITIAPAQQNKTSLTFTSELMSVDLDAPPDATAIHFAESTGSLHFDSTQSLEKLIGFYKQRLESLGWKPTTERPIKIDLNETMIFRNQAQDLLQLELHEVDNICRGTLRHESAEEVADLERLLKEEAERVAKEMKDKPELTAVSLELPAKAKVTEEKDHSLEFEIPSGTTKATIESISKQLKAAGWSEQSLAREAIAGALSYKKDSATIDLIYTDTGVTAAEISISSFSVKLKKK